MLKDDELKEEVAELWQFISIQFLRLRIPELRKVVSNLKEAKVTKEFFVEWTHGALVLSKSTDLQSLQNFNWEFASIICICLEADAQEAVKSITKAQEKEGNYMSLKYRDAILMGLNKKKNLNNPAWVFLSKLFAPIQEGQKVLQFIKKESSVQ